MYTSFERLAVTACFSSSKPNFLPRSNNRDSVDYKLSQYHPFDDYYNTNQEIIGHGSNEDNLVKSRSPRPSKIFNNFKKVKQLITSLFTSRDADRSKEEEKPSSANVSGSCLDKRVTNSEEKVDDFAVSIVVDEDSSPSYNEEFEFDRLEIQPQCYQISESLKSEILDNIDQEAERDVFLNWWKLPEKDDGYAEERNNDDLHKEVDCFSEASSDLFEIDLHGVLFFEEDKAKDDGSLSIRHVNDIPGLPSWVPPNLKNIIVELEREREVPEAILVVSKRFYPFEMDSCHNRFKIPRLCF